MIVKIKACGDLKFYTPDRSGVMELEFGSPKSLAEILEHAGIPLEYVEFATIEKKIVDKNALINSDSEISIYSMVSGG